VKPTGAVFSADRRHRYVLWRFWSSADPKLVVIGLNPSTSDEVSNDPTVERCVRRARMWGYGGLVMLNAFAFRSTDPLGLRRAPDPVQPLVRGGKMGENDKALRQWTETKAPIICGWGSHGLYLNRHQQLLELLADRQLQCFKVNRDGTPKHPLYVGYSAQAVVWRNASAWFRA
jgi:hypothetical protein